VFGVGTQSALALGLGRAHPRSVRPNWQGATTCQDSETGVKWQHDAI
jgi:hypothetical protein